MAGHFLLPMHLRKRVKSLAVPLATPRRKASTSMWLYIERGWLLQNFLLVFYLVFWPFKCSIASHCFKHFMNPSDSFLSFHQQIERPIKINITQPFSLPLKNTLSSSNFQLWHGSSSSYLSNYCTLFFLLIQSPTCPWRPILSIVKIQDSSKSKISVFFISVFPYCILWIFIIGVFVLL